MLGSQRRISVILVLALLPAACARSLPRRPAARAAKAAEPETRAETTPPFLPLEEVLKLIEGLAKSEHRLEFTDGDVTYPVEYMPLVRLGSKAVPTILHVAESAGEPWTLDLLIEILGRIGDDRARPFLESLVDDPRPNTRSEAVGALGRLGNPDSIPLLKKVLAGRVEEDRYGYGTLHVLEALLRAGDESVIPEILELGRRGKNMGFSASGILSRFPPIRKALGFKGEADEGGFESFDRGLFLKAAEDWYHREVLGKPSPHAVPDGFEFSEPLPEEKQAAWDVLALRATADTRRNWCLRAYPVDPDVREADFQKDVTLITGSGHGFTLDIHLFRPREYVVDYFYFAFRRGPKRSSFPEDEDRSVFNASEIGVRTFAAFVAGMKTILAARVEPWWSGPGTGISMTTSDFVVYLDGIEDSGGEPLRYCGYSSSTKQKEYVKLQACWNWMTRFRKERIPLAESAPTDGGRKAFSALFRKSRPYWNREQYWWWVRERMVSLSRDVGDETLVPPLSEYLEPEFKDGKASLRRTALGALNALASLTRVDFRFDERGKSRPPDEVVMDYKEWLKNR